MPLRSRGALRVLFVEDSEDDAYLIVRQLERAGLRAWSHFRVDTRESFDNALGQRRVGRGHQRSLDAALQLASKPSPSCKARELECPFIIVSGTIGEDTAVEAMRAGAHDYVLKNNLARLAPAIDRELERRRAAAAGARGTRGAPGDRTAAAAGAEDGGRRPARRRHRARLQQSADRHPRLHQPRACDAARRPERDVRFELDQVKQAGRARSALHAAAARFQPAAGALAAADRSGGNRRVDGAHARHLIGEAVQLETAGASGRVGSRSIPGQFEQVVMNLAINARDAMPHGGTLRLETSRVELDGRPRRRALQIAPGPYVMVIGRRYRARAWTTPRARGSSSRFSRPSRRARAPGWAVDGVRHPAAERRQHRRRIGR